MRRALRAGTPRIEVLTNSNPSLVPAVHEGIGDKDEAPPNQLEIVSMTLQNGEDLIVGRRLREILNSAGRKALALIPNEPLSPGVLTKDRLFISAFRAKGSDPEKEVELALDRMQSVVEAAGLTMQNLATYLRRHWIFNSGRQ